MEKQNVMLRFPKELLNQVDEYQKGNNITSRSSAIFELLRKALQISDNRKG